jgi:cell division protein FtsL
MKTLIIIIFCSIALFSQEKDSAFVKELDKQIAEKDSLVNYMQNVIIKEATENCFSGTK